MKTYDIGGAMSPLSDSCVIIDIMDHAEFKALMEEFRRDCDYDNLSAENEYIQADVSKPLPEQLHLCPGNVNAGYVLMYIVDPTGYLELDPPTDINIDRLNTAADNIDMLTAPGGRVTIIDAPAVMLPVVARLGSKGLTIISVALVEYSDEDRPSMYEVVLEKPSHRATGE